MNCVQGTKDYFKHFSQSKNWMSYVEVKSHGNLVSVPKPSNMFF